jgi:ABC-type antimicrobial peptide transport system permease subunit
MQTMKLAVGGMVLGLMASWALGRVLQNLLFGVTFSDPATFVAAMALLSLMAVLAGYLPARRAARVDPMEALRAG